MRQNYRVQEFAKLGGVTVKALRHYDRMDLLSPSRTSAGHRLYSTRDLERLRRILALKRVGVALRQMRSLLDAGPETLAARLRANRDILALEQERLRQADRAIALVEESLQHTPADAHALSRLADVTDMAQQAVRIQRYFSDEVWEPAKRFYETWPTEPWIGLCRDFEAAIAEGPASPRAADLLRRWNGLAQTFWRETPSDPILSSKLHAGFARAWRDRANWSDTLKRRFADYRMNEIAAFIGKVPAAAIVP